ncbi:32960_t:CDS:2 [Gigaspora margarita]|uniref:32960_t:CDS:1 n=1 Tax=Gigaspora margarita TaxID=4874 RepID=A0ABN7UK05_GIGMA|nr:32960_t:CDS:2 [Gigaspora margarita]
MISYNYWMWKLIEMCELARDLIGINDLKLADINYTKDGLQLDENISEGFYKELDKSSVYKCGRGGKSKGQSTCKARETHSSKFNTHVKDDDCNKK